MKYSDTKNKVLQTDSRVSQDFFSSDLILQHYLKRNITAQGRQYMQPAWKQTGKDAAGKMNEWSLLADKFSPQLIKRNHLGETINEIRFHPVYDELMKVAVASEMLRVKWEPFLRKKFDTEKHRLGFASGYLYAMSESGQYCPLCMTDGAARLIDLFGKEEDKQRLLPHIYTDNANDLYTGAMFLTEKRGGSDVGANIVSAIKDKKKLYHLNGEKWFCSNVNAEIIFALARTDETVEGTKGLSIFLIEKQLPSGERNPMDIIRLKDKLGVRSMASAEIILTDTVGKLTGKEFEGFKVMTEMIILSRLYNSVAALSCARRALIETYQYLSFRELFGKNALQHSLIRIKLTELAALHIANFYMVWRAITALDNADSGNEEEKQLFRFINPLTKKWSAETSVYMVRESMELMGGNGYIEDAVMPKLMRDVMVLPIWEGSGNVIVLDMLRAMTKSNGFEMLCKEIERIAFTNAENKKWLQENLSLLISFADTLKNLPQDEMETTAKPFFDKVTEVFQIALLIEALDEESKVWIQPAVDFLKEKYSSDKLKAIKPLSTEEVKEMIAWEF
ncbi:acyl-CoA dehydrogenase family protein [Aequorivita capsosiphonis]|uniref:acyl-CoA dehydrogenase family protein n=1 Tax=Aequorivita capsosiphonis TaxID=487317 RepID=UPI000554B8E1|nr:acyl-CoA dehydrogenase family protein [Aequorivita capsosiphonis]